MKGRGNFVSGGEHLLQEKRKAYWKEFDEVVEKGRQIGIGQKEFAIRPGGVLEGGCMIELKGIGKKFEMLLRWKMSAVRSGRGMCSAGRNQRSRKSTCLRMMAGVLAPDTGEVLVDGKNVVPRIRRSGKRYFSSRMIRITFPTPHPEI